MTVDGCAWLEVLELEYLTDLDLAVLERHAFDPFNGFFLRLHWNQPKARDELRGFGRRPVNYGPLVSSAADASTFRAGLKALARVHDPGLDHLLVDLSARGQLFFIRQASGLRFLARFDNHHESHFRPPFSRS